jgi:hypothetical protein
MSGGMNGQNMGGCNPMMGGMPGGFGGVPGGFGGVPGGFGGMPGGFGGVPGGFGGMPGGFGGIPGGGYGNACAPVYGPGGNLGGNASVDLARRYSGMNAIDVRGRLPNFTAAGGQTNNCADFVSSILQDTQGLQGHHVGVRDLEQSLLRQGWHQVPANMAQPGDVWIAHGRGHTELVSAPGGTRTIGANNDRPGHQVVFERNKNPGSGVYYSRR